MANTNSSKKSLTKAKVKAPIKIKTKTKAKPKTAVNFNDSRRPRKYKNLGWVSWGAVGLIVLAWLLAVCQSWYFNEFGSDSKNFSKNGDRQQINCQSPSDPMITISPCAQSNKK